jgi:translocation and assembly module TamB
MHIGKKILYIVLIVLVLLSIVIVSVVNSSYVIDKIAQKFAPDYNLSYEKISGNIFTGVKIKNLKYTDNVISNNIIYKWNPLSLLQKKIMIDEIKIEDANIDVIKALIASFDVDESDNNTSGSFAFDVEVEDIAISIKPFIEQGIAINKTVLLTDEVNYYSDGSIDIDDLSLEIESNLTTFVVKGNMEDQELFIDTLEVSALDTSMLEERIRYFTDQNTSSDSEDKSDTAEESPNTLLPQKIEVKHFVLSILPRVYKSAKIKQVEIVSDNLEVDLTAMLENKTDSLNIGNLELTLETNISTCHMKTALKDETLIFEYLRLKDIDVFAIQNMFNSDNNISEIPSKDTLNEEEKPNNLIPKYVNIDRFDANIIPMNYAPINVQSLNVKAQDLEFKIEGLMLRKGFLELNGSTNFAKLTFLGDVKKNNLEGKLALTPRKELFDHYNLPIREEAISILRADLNASKTGISVTLNTKAKELLKAKNGEFNLDIDSLVSHMAYDINTSKLEVKTNAKISTPYAKNIALKNTFVMDKTIEYKGEVNIETLTGFEANMIRPLQNMHIGYKGDDESVHAKLNTQELKGSFISDDMKTGNLLIETKEALNVNQFTNLPKELNATKASIKLSLPIDFDNLERLEGKALITSNVLDIDADISYHKYLTLKAKTVLSNNSLLKDFNQELKWDKLMPLDINLKMKEENIFVDLESKKIKGNVKYEVNTKKVKGNLIVAGLRAKIQGSSDEKINIDTKITSMKSLEKSITSLYTLEEFPPLEGSASIATTITSMKHLDIKLDSPELIYKADRKTKHRINNVKARVSLEASKVVLESYTLLYNKQKFFSSKPSEVNLEDDVVILDSFWLNDMLEVKGKYNLKTKMGRIGAKTEGFPIEHKYTDINAKVDIQTILEDENTTIEGEVVLLGGSIKYDIAQKTFASDSDIIFVQDIKKKSESTFMKNLSTNIQVRTQKPLELKQGDINIKLKPELGINKVQNSELLVLGSVELVKGGTYYFEGKKFVLDKSAIHFTGNPNKPLLEIKVKHRSLNHLITIHVLGTPDAPIINFSSNPSLTKEQILSVILFDSEAGGDAHSSDEMMKMMGGAMAKSALSDMGVKLDHLVLGEGNSIEVGKKLTDKMTIIYVNDVVSGVKLQYRHSPRTDSVIQMSEESQSYDIIYKDDF